MSVLKEEKTLHPYVFAAGDELRAYVQAEKAQGKKIALVPTMGALHEGHMSLIRKAHEEADIVIASIFVNPTQFGPSEDYQHYPRTWDEDYRKLGEEGVHAVFAPAETEMYPENFATTVSVRVIGEPMEGLHRPGHFDGVATIICKLMILSMPDVALFGEKDYQQLLVIRRMVTDLDLPVRVIGVPTVRDKNGLALSSRNSYLDKKELRIAAHLNKVLKDMAKRIEKGEKHKTVRENAIETLQDKGFDEIDYLEIRNAETLQPPLHAKESLRILAAVRVGETRLIDNMPVK